MKSLAKVVIILLLTVLLSGPLALAISFIPVSKYFTLLIKRVVVAILSAMEILTGGSLIFSNDVRAAQIVGLFGIGCAIFANYRIYRFNETKRPNLLI